ncbi:guanine deaminase [Flexivirga meconopsidis]|uniref:guanine deaminase n=1 Tax=Flexivirga meconopsidis TaxID=2977121 RepID=UPI00223F6B9D|nr:guanine deaminase [Flexivirga meconopsidis]
MTIYQGQILDTPKNPFTGGALRVEADGAVLVRDGRIDGFGPYAQVRSAHPDDDVVTLDSGVLIPGLIDTHVHYPQVRVIGGLGMPLLDWLEHCALPEEARLADPSYAEGVAHDFVRSLTQAGTTSALVFGSHFPAAVDALFAEAARVGPRVTAGLVLSDRILRDDLLTTPEQADRDSRALAKRWHGNGRMRYAVTPRFSLSCTDELLAVCGRILADLDSVLFTSHINENVAEIAQVTGLFETDYLGSYARHGLVGPRSVFAHNVHVSDSELAGLGRARAGVAHCPTSNAALGSGLFPLRRHLTHDVRVALGTDVGAGTGFALFKEGLQAYFAQQLLGTDGVPLTSAHLLHLATAAGADLLGLPDVGDFTVGKRFDAVWVRPAEGTTLDTALRNAADADDALAKIFALGTSADVHQVWIDGASIDLQRAG